MDPWLLISIALGLAMDAFAVAIGTSIVLVRVTPRQRFRLAFHFGLFQAMMPVIGWAAGSTVEGAINAWDHWVAFGLLAFIGTRSIVQSFRHRSEEQGPVDPTRGASLVVLSVATSIDALAVGLSFGVLGVAIWTPALVIGLVAAAMTLLGIALGSRLGALFGRRMEAVGGLVLLLIGAQILWEHLAR
ncbi:MAG: manganese efflux pump [Deltaproteobacteria bacterium]|nr:manganese efflux pump [Deltaproteobacteria bacterium]